MAAREHTQSLADFRQKIAETFDRINQTGEPEVITQDGKPIGVLLSPAGYDELAREAQLQQDVEAIRASREEFSNGPGRDVSEVFAELRAELLAMKKQG